MTTTTETLTEIGRYRLDAVYKTESAVWRNPMAGRFDKPTEKFHLDAMVVTTQKILTSLRIYENVGTVQPNTIATYEERETF
jgi:hypothetical protein